MNLNRKTIIILIITILVLFLGPDLLYWGMLDHFQSPLRHIVGDTSLYVYQLNATLRFDQPTGNPYFWENNYELGRFFVFGKLLSVLPLVHHIPTIWWTFILRAAVPLLVLFFLAKLLMALGSRRSVTWLLSFIFILLYGPMTFKGGSALTNWYLPAFLLGLLLAINFYKAERISLRSFFLILISVLLFSFHPIYFAIGIVFVGILWISRLIKSFDSRSILLFFIWLATALTAFGLVFLPFIYSRDPIFARLAQDMSFRNTLLVTRFPFLFLFAVRYLLLALATGYLWLKARKQDQIWSKNYFLLFGLAAISFLGLNSYVITGQYFLNDHFPLAEDFIALPLALILLFEKRINPSRFLKILGLALLFFTTLSILVLFYSMNFKPIYSGRWVPLFLAHLVIGLFFFKTKFWTSVFQKYKQSLIKLLLVFSLSHAVFMNYWDDRYWFPLHKEIQAYRQTVEDINTLPRGVILANPYISNLALIYSGHKVFWSPYALHDAVSTDELYQRWLRARTFFPEEPDFNGRSAVYSVFGARDNKCREFRRYIYLRWLEKLGMAGPKQAICDDSIYNDKWPQLQADSTAYLKVLKTNNRFNPAFRLDYLIVENGKDVYSMDLINKYFNQLKTNGQITIYEFKQKN